MLRGLVLSVAGVVSLLAVLTVTWSVWGRWLMDRYVHAEDLVLSPPVVKFAGFDPKLREATLKRRQVADGIRRRASHVETGARVADVLKIVRR